MKFRRLRGRSSGAGRTDFKFKNSAFVTCTSQTHSRTVNCNTGKHKLAARKHQPPSLYAAMFLRSDLASTTQRSMYPNGIFSPPDTDQLASKLVDHEQYRHGDCHVTRFSATCGATALRKRAATRLNHIHPDATKSSAAVSAILYCPIAGHTEFCYSFLCLR